MVRRDAYYRYFSCLVYVPREIFNTDLAHDNARYFNGIISRDLNASFTTYFSDSVLARLHFLIRVNPRTQLNISVSEIEQRLNCCCRVHGQMN